MTRFVGKNENPDLKGWRIRNMGFDYKKLDQDVVSYLDALPAELQRKVRVTSVAGDKHAVHSRHYKNQAIDLGYDEDLFNYIGQDVNRKNVILINPNHGTGKHLHISKRTGGTEDNQDVLFGKSPMFQMREQTAPANEDYTIDNTLSIPQTQFLEDIQRVEQQRVEEQATPEKEDVVAQLQQKTKAAMEFLQDFDLKFDVQKKMEDGGRVGKEAPKKAVIYHSNDKDFVNEANRALPLLEKKYGKGNVKIVPIEYGNALDLKKKVEENKNADHYPFDHSGSNMFGIPTVHKYQKNTSKIALKGLLSPDELVQYEKLLTEDDAIMTEKRNAFKEKFPKAPSDDNLEYKKAYKDALHDWSSNKSTDFLRTLDAKTPTKRFENFTTTWSDIFPEENNNCVYWGTCHYDLESSDFTAESGTPSFSTIDEKWHGVDSKGAANTTDSFLNSFYYKTPFKYNSPLTKPVEMKSKEIKSFYETKI